jgi:phosphoenolpyruvate carboxykinase (GTP)
VIETADQLRVLNTFGEHTPKELWDEYRALVRRLG